MSEKDNRYCKYCGGIIDADTKKCKSCGRQFFRAKTSLPIIVLSVLLLVCIGIGAGYIVKHRGTLSGELSTEEPAVIVQEDKADLYKRLSQSVVLVNVYDDSDLLVATASGFFIIDDKTLVTCEHVIDGAYYIEAVCENGMSVLCKEVIAHDAARDLAVLRCEQPANLTPLVLGDSKAVSPGDSVTVIGSPLGLQNTISEGIVGALRVDGDTDIIQITAPISSGSSGGAVFDAQGNVIGIISASYTEGQNLNLAIASDEIFEMLNEDDEAIRNILLSELFDAYRYGTSRVNIVGGKVTENSKYVFFSDEQTKLVAEEFLGVTIEYSSTSSSRVTQFSKSNGDYKYFDTGDCPASALNVYHDKLYFIRKNDNDAMSIYSCDIGDHFGENITELLKMNLGEYPMRMLVADDLIMYNVDYWNETEKEYRWAIRIYDAITLQFLGEFGNDVWTFNYYGNSIYVLETGKKLLWSLDLITGETIDYSLPEELNYLFPVEGGFLLWNYAKEVNSNINIYYFNAENNSVSKYHSEDRINFVCAGKDHKVLIVKYATNTFIVQSIETGKVVLRYYSSPGSDERFPTVYTIDCPTSIPEIGWQNDSLLGFWRTDGNSLSLVG